MNYKISILMPTYNDQSTIIEALDSVRTQTYVDWELVIINDGSTDQTEQIVRDYINEHQLRPQITYLHQSNQDQLRALLNGMKQTTGDLVMFLHSDDKLLDDQVLERVVRDFSGDAILYNLQLADENMQPTRIARLPRIVGLEQTMSRILLFLGRNIYFDTFVASREYFETWLKTSYLTWNMPFYFKLQDGQVMMADLKGIDDQVMAYRLHSANYNQSQLGKLNVLNGELRTAATLMASYHIPAYKVQFYWSRFLNKIGIKYQPLYHRQPQQKPEVVIRFILDKAFANGQWRDNQHLAALDGFYQNRATTQRTIKLEIPADEFIYLGCDMRKFNNDVLKGNLSDFYQEILSEMCMGFSSIICDRGDKKKVDDLVKFLCIDGFVEIIVK